jgi:hypothetical protein
VQTGFRLCNQCGVAAPEVSRRKRSRRCATFGRLRSSPVIPDGLGYLIAWQVSWLADQRRCRLPKRMLSGSVTVAHRGQSRGRLWSQAPTWIARSTFPLRPARDSGAQKPYGAFDRVNTSQRSSVFAQRRGSKTTSIRRGFPAKPQYFVDNWQDKSKYRGIALTHAFVTTQDQ